MCVSSYKLLPRNVDQVSLEEHFRRSCPTNKEIDHQALDLLSLMLSPNPAKRPSATECLQHPYFTDPQAEQQMAEEEFLRLTDGLQSCHEFNIKQRERKRGRREEVAPGVLATCTLGLAMCSTACSVRC